MQPNLLVFIYCVIELHNDGLEANTFHSFINWHQHFWAGFFIPMFDITLCVCGVGLGVEADVLVMTPPVHVGNILVTVAPFKL